MVSTLYIFSLREKALLLTFYSVLLINCSNEKTSDAKTNQVVNSTAYAEHKTTDAWHAPDTASISSDAAGDLIRYGRSLVANTATYLGPKGKVSQFANGMNCQNCHLKAGTQLYANSFSAVYSIYPKFRARSGTVENLERRINDCMERSMNGKKLDSLSKEMRAMVAYINWVGKDVKKGFTPVGASVEEVPFLERAADPVKGNIAYTRHCDSCHGENGSGLHTPDGISYFYPPLWGKDSYNTAAGMYRLARLAGFIKNNMPDQLSSPGRPILTDEQAWDIAAYVNSMPRPQKFFKNDWPDITKKPIDYPFGPFADQYSEAQHKYGPFKEIIEAGKNDKRMSSARSSKK